MTPDERSTFFERGLVQLANAIHARAIEEIAGTLWTHLAECHGVERGRPASWRRLNASQVRALKDRDVFAPAFGGAVREGIDSLLADVGWTEPEHPGQLLFTPPEAGPWSIPSKVWHVDAPAPGWMDALPGVQVFVFLETVPAGAGGTIAVAGSHRWIDRLRREGARDASGRSAELRGALAERVPWLRALWRDGEPDARRARFMDRAEDADGIPLQVVELTGAPGDAVLMHPWTLHAPCANAGARPRLMLTERFWSRLGR